MRWRQLFGTKSLEMLHAEMAGENRLHRILGPIGLTSLGVGGIIGAGIFVMTGRVAANEAGPGIVLSFMIAAFACALAGFCYAEFASMAPVAGSAYTYAYATLGEMFAWMIGWDLILEYAMAGATVASAWAHYYNEFLETWFGYAVIDPLCHDPFSRPGAWFNLPAVVILGLVTTVLVVGIRESAFSNTTLVVVKVGVVIFVIIAGIPFISTSNWWGIPPEQRRQPIEFAIPGQAELWAQKEHQLFDAANFLTDASANEFAAQVGVQTRSKKNTSERERIFLPPTKDVDTRTKELSRYALAVVKTASVFEQEDDFAERVRAKYAAEIPETPADVYATAIVVAHAEAKAPDAIAEKWGLLSHFGINDSLASLDNATRSRFMPYGISGIMLGAALLFFAFLGFDSVSTHAEEAIKPQRDVPFGIIGSLIVCTILYLGVSAVIVGMVPYPEIDTDAAVASAFRDKSNVARGLIALGGLAGMTSVLLITFLSQARIFLAMARDGLLPQGIFGTVHEKYRTPHISTIVTGVAMMFVAALTPIEDLEEMVNIGTFFAFIVVCAAVLLLRFKRPDAPRPFRCPMVYVVAPLGIVVNLTMMLFLAPITWARLVVWLAIGLVIYFSFGYRFSVLAGNQSAMHPHVPPPDSDSAT